MANIYVAVKRFQKTFSSQNGCLLDINTMTVFGWHYLDKDDEEDKENLRKFHRQFLLFSNLIVLFLNSNLLDTKNDHPHFLVNILL